MGGNRNNETIEQKVVERPRARATEDRATTGGETVLDDQSVLAQSRGVDVRRITRGRFPYDDWRIQKVNCREEVDVAEENYDTIMDSLNHGKPLERLKEDARMLTSIVDDIEQDIQQAINNGQVLSEEQVDHLLDRLWVCDQAHSILIHDNQSIDAARKYGIFALLGLLIQVSRSHELARFEQVLSQLRDMLEAAERETNEAWAKLTVNLIVSFALPQVGLVTRGGIFVAQVVMDHMLGEPNPAAQGVTATGHITEALGNVKGLSEKTREIAQRTGKATGVAGFLFDADSVAAGYSEEIRIRKLIIEANKLYKERVLPKVISMERDLERLKQEILPRLRADLRQRQTDLILSRDELRRRMQEVGYWP